MAKRKITGDELSARAKANVYQRGAHREEDSRRDRNKHGDGTKKDLDGASLAKELRTLTRSPRGPSSCKGNLGRTFSVK